jgi:hypothetical protein
MCFVCNKIFISIQSRKRFRFLFDLHHLFALVPTTHTATNRAASRVCSLLKLWSLIVEHCRGVGAFRMMLACCIARQGAKEWLRTLPGLVVCAAAGRRTGDRVLSSGVWRLDLRELQLKSPSDLTSGH